jgi:nitrite reductase/ring-hydroxylating ferredoxin subunit
MLDCSEDLLLEAWFPIATGGDLPKRHIFQAELLGQEMAVWRADDDHVNVWENRCLHRGVRLTIGSNMGDRLKCRYHGWLYASRTAACTYIPAHPANAPAQIVKCRTYKGAERHGLVWATMKATSDQPPALPIDDGSVLVLRSIAVRASAPLVAEALLDYRFAPSGDVDADPAACDIAIEPADAFTLAGRSRKGSHDTAIMLFVQPVEQRRSVVHGLVLGAVAAEQLTVLRHHNTAMKRVRDDVEARGQAALDLASPAAGPAIRYRAFVSGRFTYGTVG